MISVAEAKDFILKKVSPLEPSASFLMEAAGHVLAQDIIATIDIPAFDQSSMDGYAIRFKDKELRFTTRGEMAAGATETLRLNEGEAIRIFTGAPLPSGADTVVMQEKVICENNTLIIDDAHLKQGSHVRNKGAEVKAGSLAMAKNCYLSPAAIGFLAGIGVAKVLVYPMPLISIIVTGNELQKPGNNLSPGQVYESNSYSLTAALKQSGIKEITMLQAPDQLLLLKEVVDQALTNSNIIILTGGVSVGDYDFVVEATKLCGIHQVFHKVKQRPGKPLYFGMKGHTLVFGLPGNPSSVLSCFYNYVLPAIKLMANKKDDSQKLSAVLTKDYAKAVGLTHFLKGTYLNGLATALSAQESFQLSSFALADCLICLEETHGDYYAGETVEVYLLPR